MSFTLRAVKVPPNSVNLEEARSRVFEFFKTACRSIPSIMEIYNLDDIVSKSQLRSIIASEIRKNANVTNPKVFGQLFVLNALKEGCVFMIVCVFGMWQIKH
ncbi:hypothetical protein CICLE_v10002826mg [Citrus x clementina]|uniref:NADH dehydrogenase [ubiquinone] 1 alpha subcomplex subunit 6 n=1 Tax=Citrus clementina TaxID=85681 RepID=V4V1M5_CITCL|nr:hypothetical protein CICLE_v10002826mg [Citrus x clementina]